MNCFVAVVAFFVVVMLIMKRFLSPDTLLGYSLSLIHDSQSSTCFPLSHCPLLRCGDHYSRDVFITFPIIVLAILGRRRFLHMGIHAIMEDFFSFRSVWWEWKPKARQRNKVESQSRQQLAVVISFYTSRALSRTFNNTFCLHCHLLVCRRKDGRKDGRMNGRTDGRTDGPMNERTIKRTDGRKWPF